MVYVFSLRWDGLEAFDHRHNIVCICVGGAAVVQLQLMYWRFWVFTSPFARARLSTIFLPQTLPCVWAFNTGYTLDFRGGLVHCHATVSRMLFGSLLQLWLATFFAQGGCSTQVQPIKLHLVCSANQISPSSYIYRIVVHWPSPGATPFLGPLLLVMISFSIPCLRCGKQIVSHTVRQSLARSVVMFDHHPLMALLEKMIWLK